MHRHDVTEIINLVNLYAVAVDTQHWDLLADVFTADAMADFGGGAVWQDLASLTRDFIIIHQPFDATQHVTTNHVVRVAGDDAHCLSYVRGRFIRRGLAGGDSFESGGWYDDRLLRTPAGWRIRERVCRTVWCEGNPEVMGSTPDPAAEFPLFSLKTEATAKRLRFLAAITTP